MSLSRRLGVLPVLLLAVSPASAEDEWKFGPGTSVSRGSFQFTLKGYVQADFRDYRNWEVESSDLRNDDAEISRLRGGFEVQWGRVSAQLDVDFREEDEHFKDAYVDLRISKALRLRGGNFKLPMSPEWLNSPRRIDFVERSRLASTLVPGRDWGGMVHGELGKWLLYQAGFFAGDGRTDSGRAGNTAAARLVLSPAKGLDLGGSYVRGEVEAAPEGAPRPKGVRARAASGYIFFDRKFTQGERQRWGAEASFTRGPVSLNGEGLWEKEERAGQASSPLGDDLPSVLGRGWYVSGTWLLTGEKKSKTVKPRRAFPHGPGAIEIGVRYESLHFDDDGPPGGFEGAGQRSRNLRPAENRALTAGLSWWPVRYVRLLGNVVVERFEDPLLAPEPGRQGNYVTLLGRLQFELP